MRSEFDDILKNRLHDPDNEGESLNWEEFVIHREKHDQKNRSKKRIFIIYKTLGYAAGLLLFIILSILLNDKKIELNDEAANKRTATNDYTINNASNNTNNDRSPSISLSAASEDNHSFHFSDSTSSISDTGFIKAAKKEKSGEPEQSATEHSIVKPVFLSLKNSELLVKHDTSLKIPKPVQYDIETYVAVLDHIADNEEKTYKSWETSLLLGTLQGSGDNPANVVDHLNALITDAIADGNSFDPDAYWWNPAGSPVTPREEVFLFHQIPVSVSIIINKGITNRWSIGSGIEYTHLESSSNTESIDFYYYYEQKLHYIGVPILLSWSVTPEASMWTVRALNGITIEKSVSVSELVTQTGTSSASIKNKENLLRPMLSIDLGISAGYEIAPFVDLEINPTINYYFYTEGQPQSYITESPWNISLRIGFSFKL